MLQAKFNLQVVIENITTRPPLGNQERNRPQIEPFHLAIILRLLDSRTREISTEFAPSVQQLKITAIQKISNMNNIMVEAGAQSRTTMSGHNFSRELDETSVSHFKKVIFFHVILFLVTILSCSWCLDDAVSAKSKMNVVY